MKACAEVERGGQGAGVGGGSIRRGEAAVGGGDDWGKWALAGEADYGAPGKEVVMGPARRRQVWCTGKEASVAPGGKRWVWCTGKRREAPAGEVSLGRWARGR